MYIRTVLGFAPTFFTSKYSFSSGVGYVMRPILLIMWTAFQSFILRVKIVIIKVFIKQSKQQMCLVTMI